MDVLIGDTGGIVSISCDTTPPKVSGDSCPRDAGLTGDMCVAHETFCGGDYGAAVGAVDRMAMI
jgi:hypothetical protein